MKWKGDMKGDNKMDFIHAFYPIFILTSLYIIKLILIRVEHTLIKFIMSISVIALIVLGETLFDSIQTNDARMWMIAIPVSIFLICESILDAIATWYTYDERKIIFYSL
jgi:hypothetical protein